MNSSARYPVMEFHDLMSSIDTNLLVLDAHKNVTGQLNMIVQGDPITVEEFAAALESQIIVSAMANQLRLMRNPDMFDDDGESYHAE